MPCPIVNSNSRCFNFAAPAARQNNYACTKSIRVFVICSALVLFGPAAPLWAKPGEQKSSKDCFWQLLHGTGAIDCAVPLRLSDEEKKELRKITRSYMQDVSCDLKIKLKRSYVVEVETKAEGDVTIPAQNVSCTVIGKKSSSPITFSFAPKLSFKDGQAVKASPQMGQIKGLSKIISWPVKQWVNRADMIEKPLLRVINAYRARKDKLKQNYKTEHEEQQKI